MRQAFRVLALAGLLACPLGARPLAAEDTFTLAILPDLQPETSGTRFQERLQWLVENRSKLNLKMVLQVGDMMNFNDEAQYKHQSEALKVLDGAGIPYATCLGNHDTAAVKVDGGSAAPGNVNANLRNTARYNAYFPTTRFKLLAGTYEPNKIDNACHVLKAGGLNWLVVNLELWARPGAVEWARTTVAKYPDHNVVFLTHAHQVLAFGFDQVFARVVVNLARRFAMLARVFAFHAQLDRRIFKIVVVQGADASMHAVRHAPF